MAMGAAAGVNAALATSTKKAIREVKIEDVQDSLIKSGAVLTTP
jgi:hypothetical protein